MGVSKDYGGLGFRELNCFNKALVAKQVWRIWTMPDNLVACIMKAKYYPDCSILEAPLRRKPSFAWRSIQSSCALIKEGLIWRIGNGKTTRIWEDRWILRPSSFRIQSPPSILDPLATVSQLLDAKGHSWNQHLLHQLFSVEEQAIIQSLPISFTDREDRLIWRGADTGIFTVKSAYHIQKTWESSQKAKCSVRKNQSKVWKTLWKLNIPNAEKVFFWRACHDILPTRDNLVRRKVIPDPT